MPNIQELSPDQAEITKGDNWKTFFFFAYGFTAEPNCRRCPETARLLKRLPAIKTAFFSILRAYSRALRLIAASPFIQDAARNYEQWERRVSAIWDK